MFFPLLEENCQFVPFGTDARVHCFEACRSLYGDCSIKACSLRLFLSELSLPDTLSSEGALLILFDATAHELELSWTLSVTATGICLATDFKDSSFPVQHETRKNGIVISKTIIFFIELRIRVSFQKSVEMFHPLRFFVVFSTLGGLNAGESSNFRGKLYASARKNQLIV